MTMRNETATHSVKRTRARNGKFDRVLAMSLYGRSQKEICETIPISRSSLWRLRRCEAFQTQLKAARAHAFDAMLNSLHHSAIVFAETLAAVCVDPKARGSEKATAARSGLDTLLKSVELFDMVERVRKIEQAATGADDRNDNLRALDEQAAQHYAKDVQ